MQFSKIAGQALVKSKLVQMVKENRISHAMLFLGPEGCGKLGLAIAYAQFINCQGKTSEHNDSCGTCPSCRKYEQLAHPDLHFIYPIAATKDVPKKPLSKDFITKWRKFIRENNAYAGLEKWYETIGIENKQGIINADDCNEIIRILNYKSYEAPFKVMIIWMVEKLFHAAAPKILKILEEPPDRTLFILVAEEAGQIINTILSRTQLIKIPRLKDEEVRATLINAYGIEPKVAHSATIQAQGNLIAALEYIKDEGSDEYFTIFSNWMRLCYKINMPELIEWVGMISKIGREKQKAFIATSLQILQESLSAKMLNNQHIRRVGEQQKFIHNFSGVITNQFIAGFSSLLNEASYHIERNANPSIMFMDISLKINQMIHKKA